MCVFKNVELKQGCQHRLEFITALSNENNLRINIQLACFAREKTSFGGSVVRLD